MNYERESHELRERLRPTLMKSDGCASCSAYRCWFVDMLEKMVKMMKPNCGQGGIKALVTPCTTAPSHMTSLNRDLGTCWWPPNLLCSLVSGIGTQMHRRSGTSRRNCTADHPHGRAHFWITDLQQEAENGEEHQQAVRLAAGAGEGGVEAPALVIVAAPAHAAQRALVSLRALRALVGAAGAAIYDSAVCVKLPSPLQSHMRTACPCTPPRTACAGASCRREATYCSSAATGWPAASLAAARFCGTALRQSAAAPARHQTSPLHQPHLSGAACMHETIRLALCNTLTSVLQSPTAARSKQQSSKTLHPERAPEVSVVDAPQAATHRILLYGTTDFVISDDPETLSART